MIHEDGPVELFIVGIPTGRELPCRVPALSNVYMSHDRVKRRAHSPVAKARARCAAGGTVMLQLKPACLQLLSVIVDMIMMAVIHHDHIHHIYPRDR